MEATEHLLSAVLCYAMYAMLCPTLPYPALPCPALPCATLLCHTLPYPALHSPPLLVKDVTNARTIHNRVDYLYLREVLKRAKDVDLDWQTPPRWPVHSPL